MIRNFFFLLFSILVIASQAQTFAAVKDEAALRQKIAASAKATKSIKADFVQEKNVSMLAEKLISKGIFAFRQNNQVRLEYQQPFQYLMVINNGKITIRDEAKTTEMDMHKSKMFQQINNIIVQCVQGNVVNSTDFKVQLSESANQIKMEMTPLNKNLKDFFNSIVVLLEKKDFSVAKMIMNEKSGDFTSILFKNKELNATLPDNWFVVAK